LIVGIHYSCRSVQGKELILPGAAKTLRYSGTPWRSSV